MTQDLTQEGYRTGVSSRPLMKSRSFMSPMSPENDPFAGDVLMRTEMRTRAFTKDNGVLTKDGYRMGLSGPALMKPRSFVLPQKELVAGCVPMKSKVHRPIHIV